YTNGGNVYYNGSTYYDPTANQYYAQNQYSNPNFYITRVGRDGGARNVLATVCNNGADMSQFKDLSIGFKDLSKNTSFRATQYVKLLSGQCRDVSVNFSSFAIDFSGVHTFEVTADPDNRFAERDENDNSLKADIFVNK
ncbi:MAG: CARDB domain-containing protein, partial [Patescibacteria group bacterium]